MEVQCVVSVKTENKTDYQDQIVTISTTNDEGGRFYLESENGIAIGIGLYELMKFMEKSIIR